MVQVWNGNSDRKGVAGPTRGGFSGTDKSLIIFGLAVALGLSFGLVSLAAVAGTGLPAMSFAIFGLIALPLVVLRPKLALFVLFIDVGNVYAIMEGRLGFSIFTAAITVALIAIAVGMKRGTVFLVWSPVFLMALGFLASRAIALFASQDLPVHFAIVANTGKDLLYFFAVTTLLCSITRTGPTMAITAVKILVLMMAVLAGLTFVQEFVLHNSTTFGGFSNVLGRELATFTRRHTGPLHDANDWARMLVLFAPLALTVWASQRRGWRRALWLCPFVAISTGIYLTQSRGGSLAWAAAVALWLVFAGRRYRLLLLAAPVVVVGLLAVLPGTAERLGTLGESGQAPAEGGDQSLVGRFIAGRAALAVFADHPAIGVGPGNFEQVEPDYQRRMGVVIVRHLATHDLYLELAAENGLLGLACWLLFYGSAVFVALRARLTFRRLPAGESSSVGSLLSAGVLAGLTGWALASLFLNLPNLRVLVIVVALGIALDVDAQRLAARYGAASDREPQPNSARV